MRCGRCGSEARLVLAPPRLAETDLGIAEVKYLLGARLGACLDAADRQRTERTE